jgi:hypothetical protein
MELALLGSLAVLALIDSTSFGTLLIPAWLLMHPGRVRVARMLVFLGTVAVFYFAVGVAVALGADAFLPQISRMLDTRPAMWAQLVVGVALFFWSFRIEHRNKTASGSGRLVSWRERALSDGGSVAAVAGLALTAAAVEVSTMLPYIAAIGLVTTAALSAPYTVLLMAGYCLVMIVPALVLLAARMAAGRHVIPLLTRLSDWMVRSNAMAWVVGIVGFLLARDAAFRLELLADLGVRFG